MANPEQLSPREFKEVEKERANLTVYLMRHGESGKDKTDPKRGLTDKGRQEVRTNFAEIINQLIREEVPDFNKWDDPKAKQEALKKALGKVEIHLADSGTDRTLEQVWVEQEELEKMGVKPEDLFITKKAYQWKGREIPQTAGPGVERRLKGVKGIEKHPEFRKKIGDLEYQKKLGISDELVAWALTPEDEIPEGVENRRQMEERMNTDLQRVSQIAQGHRLEDYPKRVVYVANSHASIITLAASSKFNVPMEKLDGVGNAEGMRFDFYGDGKQEYRPFGPKLEEKLAGLKGTKETEEEKLEREAQE